jgi:hypothetical protein
MSYAGSLCLAKKYLITLESKSAKYVHFEHTEKISSQIFAGIKFSWTESIKSLRREDCEFKYRSEHACCPVLGPEDGPHECICPVFKQFEVAIN